MSGSIFESITDAVATTANDDNGEKVDSKDGNGINDQRQISDAENGRETFNSNKIKSNYEENKMKEMGDKNNKSDDDEEKNDDTDKKKSHQDRISPDIIRSFFSNFTRNCQKPSFKKYLQQMPHNLKALLPPQIKSKKRERRSSKTDESDRFINCVRTYRRKLNEEILSQKQFISNGGLENLGGKYCVK